MRKADLPKNHEPLDEAIARYRTFMRKCIDAKRVVASPQEKRDLAESVILRLCAHWERFVDEHLADCVNVYPDRLGEHVCASIPRNPSKDLCVALLFGGRYLDFKCIGDLKGFSKKVLPDAHNPFLKVKQSHAVTIDFAFKIRNYLSHYSAAAKRALRRECEKRFHDSKLLEPGQKLLAYEGHKLWGIFDAFEGASADMKASYQSRSTH